MYCDGGQAAVLGVSFAFAVMLCFDFCTPSSAVVYCPPLWIPWGSSCYRLTGQGASWDEGQASCRDMGAVMAAPHSEQENTFMATTTKNAGPSWLWVGCKFIDRAWRCEGQEVGQAYSNWRPGEPSIRDGSSPSSDYCAYFGSTTQGWNDVPCTEPPKAMCVLRSPAHIQHQGFSQGNAQQQQLNSCLVDHVIREFVTKSASRCASACLKEPGCRSFNIKGTKQEQKLCQLNDANRADDPEKFQEVSTRCVYYSA
ncbi:C-type lectin domain family 6 member A-like [Patiria miniata]|uniref:C-type lectin domain-containing protein n=1 Tax=Patiria miniata TaxID=46514 RepID=A0A914A5A7_PATMI|nr:C-type lectin domain family 6 member A-like [Patiria miniata]